MSRSKKFFRYHREIFFPDWSQEEIEKYIQKILSRGSVTYSLHALEKTIDYSLEYGKNFLLFVLRNITMDFEHVFEFYFSNTEVKKACFRCSFEELPVDITLVISADGVVITLYVTNKGDYHKTLDKKLYERS